MCWRCRGAWSDSDDSSRGMYSSEDDDLDGYSYRAPIYFTRKEKIQTSTDERGEWTFWKAIEITLYDWTSADDDPEGNTSVEFKFQFPNLLVKGQKVALYPHHSLGGFQKANVTEEEFCSIVKVQAVDQIMKSVGNNIYEVTLMINAANIIELVRQGKEIFFLSEILSDITTDIYALQNSQRDAYPWTKPDNHKTSIQEESIPQPENIKIPMYQYQLDALTWMKELEDNGGGRGSVSLLKEWKKIPGGRLFFDITKQGKAFLNRDASTCEISAKGGVYADAMGLGKTMVVMALIHTNPAPLPEKSSVEAFMDLDKGKLRSRATLVVAPNHLCKQWIEEFNKCLKKPLRTVIITGIRQLAKYTYQDICLADLVVVSFQFLRNKNYLNINRNAMNFVEDVNRGEEKNKLIMSIAEQNFRNHSPKLHQFHWHRLVIDEAHEVIDMYKPIQYLNTFLEISSRFPWYVTGTPFPNISKFNACCKLFRTNIEGIDSDTDSHRGYVSWPVAYQLTMPDFLYNHLYWRNTRESANGSNDLPPLEEKVIFLKFSKIERAMYNDAKAHYDDTRLRQICCHPQISKLDRSILGDEGKSLEEIKEAMITHKERSIKTLEARAEREEKELEAMEKKNGGTKEEVKNRKIAIEEKKKKHKETAKELGVTKSTLQFFLSIDSRMSKQEPCCICLEELEDQLAVTTCGHIFHHQCIVGSIRHHPECPLCRQKLGLVDISDPSKKKEEKEGKKEQVDDPMEDLISRCGTKMAHLIQWMRELKEKEPESKCILFSQWDEMLHQVGSTLTCEGVGNVYVKGSVFARNNAISTFKNDDNVRAIMLSLENAASGMNLTEATYVVLLDAVAGTREEARAIESQAIGRSHRTGQKKKVTVVRLIIEDTIEHELYLRNRVEERGVEAAPGVSEEMAMLQSRLDQRMAPRISMLQCLPPKEQKKKEEKEEETKGEKEETKEEKKEKKEEAKEEEKEKSEETKEEKREEGRREKRGREEEEERMTKKRKGEEEVTEEGWAKVALLISMGFENGEDNVAMLKKHNWDTEAAVLALTDQ
ncbi:putative superfamily II helicase [Planoprotostelium fungivorum]|uniref:Putative superfamily II helicase n=1 Tax=Planoprotostelium fungivorum TaxID=1890364 RepID=A0A2P6NCI0_9EUKA|nr:putative superfamily II helicase [Planoprotostelium fungivorum]